MSLIPKSSNASLKKFEAMLKTNEVYFFDAIEFEEIINYYLDLGKNNFAKQALRLGLTQHPNSFTLKLLKAELLIFDGKTEIAFELLDHLQALEPNNSEVYVQKAAIFSKNKNHKEAVELLQLALKCTEDKADILSLIGMEYLYIDSFNEALFNFAKCLEVDFEDYSALHNVIFCFDMQNKHQEAIKYLTNYLDTKNPYSEVAWHQLGKQYFTLEKYHKALEAFDYSVLIDEEFIGGYIEKAKTLEELKQHKKAIYNYKIALQLDDPTAFVYHRIAYCYQRLEKIELATQFYQKAVIEDPLLDKAWIGITTLYLEKKQYKKALYTIKKALDIEPEKTSYLRLYALINMKLQLYRKAADAFCKCLTLKDIELTIWIGLADALCFAKNYEEALKILLKSKNLFKNFAEIEYRLGALFFKHNNIVKGEQHLLNAFAIDFEYRSIIKDIFPDVYRQNKVQELIKKYKNNCQ